MNYTHVFRKFLACSPVVCSLVLAALLAGCDGDSDSAGVDSYFKANPYSSLERDEPLATTLTISPSSAQISIIGQKVVFTASGGTGNYYWAVSSEDYGTLDSSGANQCVYICKKVGNNDVILTDDGGHYAAAHITPKVDALSVAPSSVSLASGARYASFTVSGGTAPYVWTSGNPSLGTISYSSATSYTAGYTAVAGAYGQNTITVQDAEGRVATATVTQSQ